MSASKFLPAAMKGANTVTVDVAAIAGQGELRVRTWTLDTAGTTCCDTELAKEIEELSR